MQLSVIKINRYIKTVVDAWNSKSKMASEKREHFPRARETKESRRREMETVAITLITRLSDGLNGSPHCSLPDTR